jgi:predicted trehalose synthase
VASPSLSLQAICPAGNWVGERVAVVAACARAWRGRLCGSVHGGGAEQAAYLRRMDQVGRRVAELQLALASRDDIVDFAPEAIAADDVRSWTEGLLRRAGRAFDDLA